ncbi:hypothetical protein V6582_18960 [Agrobacterium vitis]|uniref:hypothetical protein n=1 Tax=Agrobacterium vitis TaxID=373 RepID=UPI0012E80CE4|nr:hypothetical protein [Agrobacterium vitis]MVA23414.1 hypothetical protein [Agrobacterium vitis]
MTRFLTSLALASALILSATQGFAQAPNSDRCVNGGMGNCQSKPGKPAQKKANTHERMHQNKLPSQKTTKQHRGKSVDPMTTCAMGSKSPCKPQRP